MGWRKNGNMSSSAEMFKDFVIEATSSLEL
jgi:hypothetical protein